MARLTNLPAELLLPILAHLSIIDLPTFLTSQATCRLFRLVAQDVLCRPPAPFWEILMADEECMDSGSITFGFSPPITHVEIIKNYSSEDFNEDGRDHVQYLQVDMPDGGQAATLGNETGSWELLLGARLRSYDLLVEYECFIADDEDLVDDGPGAARSAILYVRGGTVEGQDQDRRFDELEEDEVEWVPERILGNVPGIRLASA
ncbi:hypothetical protein VP1G_03835 [Cytospora mali]|uniref:F-box domain-containing protein n=1 Tax=Cytospora mali TaxID=578113 RepID=A0A194UY13_CYTMA|nr:hypothetical protein VP1G_03835 [Valsa mali var. pyri (nom. inval.)]